MGILPYVSTKITWEALVKMHFSRLFNSDRLVSLCILGTLAFRIALKLKKKYALNEMEVCIYMHVCLCMYVCLCIYVYMCVCKRDG